MENNDVVSICGNYPEDFIKLDLKSDPNYVFKNDPDFTAVRVWDVEENSVFVNSFQECEHYVSGGWGYDPTYLNEQTLQNTLCAVVLIAITLIAIIRNKKLLN